MCHSSKGDFLHMAFHVSYQNLIFIAIHSWVNLWKGLLKLKKNLTSQLSTIFFSSRQWEWYLLNKCISFYSWQNLVHNLKVFQNHFEAHWIKDSKKVIMLCIVFLQSKSPHGTTYSVEADSDFYTVQKKLLVPPPTNSPRKSRSAPVLPGMFVSMLLL